MKPWGIFTRKDAGYVWLFGDFTGELRRTAHRTAQQAIECGRAFMMPEVTGYNLLGTNKLGVGVHIGIDNDNPAYMALTFTGGKRVLRALAMAAGENPFTTDVSDISRRDDGDWELRVTMALITDPVTLDYLSDRQLESTGP